MALKLENRCITCGRKEREKKKRPPRTLTDYNIFFQAMMRSPAIKAMEHKDRAKAIGKMWNMSKVKPVQLTSDPSPESHASLLAQLTEAREALSVAMSSPSRQ
jgi:hypothetical protein